MTSMASTAPSTTSTFARIRPPCSPWTLERKERRRASGHYGARHPCPDPFRRLRYFRSKYGLSRPSRTRRRPMRRFRFRASVILPVLALVLAAAGGVVAGTQSSDEQALQPAGARGDVERRVNARLAKMTLQEKLEQIQLLPDFMVTEDEVRNGLGSVLSVTDPARIRELQRIAVEESRLKIPLLFAFDTIHGFRTIFPIPLAAGASFDPRVAFNDHRYGARESAAVGLKQTYAPMVDVSHEPRWGRIAEAAGEDPYLNSVLGAARVKAIQGDDYSAPDKLVASPKHYVAYGQPESGRDYNTTDMSVQRLRNLYLPPFKAT